MDSWVFLVLFCFLTEGPRHVRQDKETKLIQIIKCIKIYLLGYTNILYKALKIPTKS